MQITLNYDSTVNEAPVGFKTALQTAVSVLDSMIKNPIIITVQNGYGEDHGSIITGNTLAVSQQATGMFMPYGQLVATLRTAATSADDYTFLSDLPAADPTHGGAFYVSIAQQKSWGIVSPSSNEIDGYVGFSRNVIWDSNPGNGVAANTFDLVGVALHELTHTLGRIAPYGFYTAMDLLAACRT